MQNLKKEYKWSDLKNRNKLTNFENKLLITKGDRCERGMYWGFGIGICTWWYMEWLASGDLLYSTGNSSQYSVIIHMGKDSEKEWIPIHVNSVRLLYSRNYHSIVNQLCFIKILKTKKKKWSSHCGTMGLVVPLEHWDIGSLIWHGGLRIQHCHSYHVGHNLG